MGLPGSVRLNTGYHPGSTRYDQSYWLRIISISTFLANNGSENELSSWLLDSLSIALAGMGMGARTTLRRSEGRLLTVRQKCILEDQLYYVPQSGDSPEHAHLEVWRSRVSVG